MTMRAGDKWARVECVKDCKVELKEYGQDEDGKEYVVASEEKPGWVLRCGCGREWSVIKKEFRGKRLVRDCGCGVYVDQGFCVMMPFSTREVLKRYVVVAAQREGVTVNRWLNELVRERMERGMRDDD